jgi:competence protein ComGF
MVSALQRTTKGTSIKCYSKSPNKKINPTGGKARQPVIFGVMHKYNHTYTHTIILHYMQESGMARIHHLFCIKSIF